MLTSSSDAWRISSRKTAVSVSNTRKQQVSCTATCCNKASSSLLVHKQLSLICLKPFTVRTGCCQLTALGLVTRSAMAVAASANVSRIGTVVHQNCDLK